MLQPVAGCGVGLEPRVGLDPRVGDMMNAAGGRVLQVLVLLMKAIQTDGKRVTKRNNEESDGSWTFWCVTFMYTLLVATLAAAAGSWFGGVRPQQQRPAAPVPGPRPAAPVPAATRTMATQFQTRYSWSLAKPQFEPLTDWNHGAWEIVA